MIFFLAAALAGASNWPVYTNARFGYSICYPAAFKPQPEADNSDGRRFTGASGAELLVFGQYAIGRSLADWAADQASTYIGNKGRITYRAGRGDWRVLSGNDAGSQFYIKTVKRDDRFVTFQLRYPVSQAARYRPIVETLSRCLVVSEPPF